MNFMNTLNSFVLAINEPLWAYVLVYILLLLGLYFTIKTRFVQFRYLFYMVKLLGEGVNNKNPQGISSFQAFAISIASRVGVGNIAGVATAIAIGGPGAVFWMWVIALLGMSSAFVESVLAQAYKKKDGESFIGGPAYYIQTALKNRFLGVFFAILISVTYGFVFNMVQINTFAVSLETFHISRLTVGIIVAIFTALVIFGGIKRIATFSGIFVPVMALFYIIIAGIVIITHINQIPTVLGLIFHNAFNGMSALGGTLGIVMMQGIKRGLFTNEAGMGSAPNAAATAYTSHPVKQGLIQSLSVFTDTIIICSCTAFIILFSGFYNTGLKGIELTQKALTFEIGNTGRIFVVVAIFIFAFSTIIGNYYYGESNIKFISKKSHVFLFFYRVFVVLLVVAGATAEFSFIWNLADLFMALMALVNLYAITRLFPIVKVLLVDFDAQKKEGKDPAFKKKTLSAFEFESDSWD